MLWLARPPHLRRAAAGLLVAVAFWSEFGPTPATDVWVAVSDVAAGEALTPELFERRSVRWEDGPATIAPDGVAAVDIAAGDFLLASLSATVAAPPGWMVLAAPLPPGASPGTEATVVLIPEEPSGSDPRTVPAYVVGGSTEDPFGEGLGTIAVPPEWLGEVVAAGASQRVVVAVSALEE